MPQVEVCLSPELLHLYSLDGKIAVVNDILRATSTMIAALDSGVKAVRPVVSIEDAETYLQHPNTLVAGERNGIKIPSFDLGNSPLEILNIKEQVAGQTLVMSTTNGTKAIDACREAGQVIIGAFTNLEATLQYLAKQEKDILVLCAGWKGRVNMEDSLYAGAIANGLHTTHTMGNDSALLTSQLYKAHKESLFAAVKASSHFERLANHGVEEDIKHCMRIGNSTLVAVLQDNLIIRQ